MVAALIVFSFIVFSVTAIDGKRGYLNLNVEALSQGENDGNTCYKEYSNGIRMLVPICDPRVPTGMAIPCDPPSFLKVLDYRTCY